MFPTSTALDYAYSLVKRLPRGAIWSRNLTVGLNGFLHGCAYEFSRAHNRIRDVLLEANPATATELIDAWEALLGLPDACTETPPTTLAARRLAAAGKLAAQGGATQAYFVAVALAHGYDVDITEPKPFRAGDHAGDRVWGEEWAFVWIVNVQNATFVYFRAGSRAGDRLVEVIDESMVCLFEAIKPKHTVVIFNWTGVPF